ncbi:MAG: hypothetical protein WC091_19860, partial [Sulfuricellaceae bacterium]
MLGSVDWYAILQREAGILEGILGLKLIIDRVAVDELEEMAKKTLASFNQDKPSAAKTAGNVVFWIKKLKPVSRAPDSPNDYRLVNELLAIILETSVERAGVCGFPGAGHTRQPTAWAQEAQRRGMVIPFPSLVVATPPCARKT